MSWPSHPGPAQPHSGAKGPSRPPAAALLVQPCSWRHVSPVRRVTLARGSGLPGQVRALSPKPSQHWGTTVVGWACQHKDAAAPGREAPLMDAPTAVGCLHRALLLAQPSSIPLNAWHDGLWLTLPCMVREKRPPTAPSAKKMNMTRDSCIIHWTWGVQQVGQVNRNGTELLTRCSQPAL